MDAAEMKAGTEAGKAMQMARPPVSPGRIVLFHEEGGPYPSIVTAVNDNGTVELATFGRNSLYFQHAVPEGGPDLVAVDKGRWTWPPRS